MRPLKRPLRVELESERAALRGKVAWFFPCITVLKGSRERDVGVWNAISRPLAVGTVHNHNTVANKTNGILGSFVIFLFIKPIILNLLKVLIFNWVQLYENILQYFQCFLANGLKR